MQNTDRSDNIQVGLWIRSSNPMEYIVMIPRIVAATWMSDKGPIEERLAHLVRLKEDRFIAGFYQQVEKYQ